MSSARDMFDVSEIEISSNKKDGSNVILKTSPDNGIQGVWKGAVRFLPYLKNKDLTSIRKYERWLVNPITGEGKMVDSLRTIDKGKECPIVKTYYSLINSKDASKVEEGKKNWSTNPKYYSLVQILDDKQKPENIGKIMVWSYGIKIQAKIDDEITPSYGPPRKPYDIFVGRPFHIEIPKVGGWPNYDKCKFVSAEEIGIPTYRGEGGKPLDMTKEEDIKEYAKFLQDNSPDMSKFEFREWTPEIQQHVDECVRIVLGSSSGIKSNFSASKITEVESLDDLVDEDLDDTMADDLKSLSKESKPKESKSKETSSKKGNLDLNDIDDFDINLDDIDIEIDDD